VRFRTSARAACIVVQCSAFACGAAVAQAGHFPYRSSAPPPLAGLDLNATRAHIDSVLGSPDSTSESQGWQSLVYRARGVALTWNKYEQRLYAVVVTQQQAGELDHIRVGDPKDSVVSRWGEPDRQWPHVMDYGDGDGWWAVAVRLDDSDARVVRITLARVLRVEGD